MSRVNDKIKLLYTEIMCGIPELDNEFQPLVWCPMMIKLKEQKSFTMTDPV